MFENIIGNEKNKNILKKSIEQNQISHSYIFSGIEGIGKKEIAKQFAKEILCSNIINNPDFFLIEPEDGKIKIDTIRELQKKIAEKPINLGKKVYIINDAELMTKEAQNALLKTLEEPPEYAVLILITSNENNLLSTIKSRCTRMSFSPLDNKEVEKYIKSNYDINLSERILELSQGSIGRAIKLSENQELYNNVEKILVKMQEKDLIDIIKLSEEIYKSKDEIKYILEYMNSLSLQLSKKDIKYIKCIGIIEDTKKRLKANSNYDMSIDNMIFNMWEEVNEKNNRS